jgi:hypothetical protein
MRANMRVQFGVLTPTHNIHTEEKETKASRNKDSKESSDAKYRA